MVTIIIASSEVWPWKLVTRFVKRAKVHNYEILRDHSEKRVKYIIARYCEITVIHHIRLLHIRDTAYNIVRYRDKIGIKLHN